MIPGHDARSLSFTHLYIPFYIAMMGIYCSFPIITLSYIPIFRNWLSLPYTVLFRYIYNYIYIHHIPFVDSILHPHDVDSPREPPTPNRPSISQKLQDGLGGGLVLATDGEIHPSNSTLDDFFNYKVVPPSYKLVYNPINYRYITYKP